MTALTISDISAIIGAIFAGSSALLMILIKINDTAAPQMAEKIAMHSMGLMLTVVPLLSTLLLLTGWPKFGLSLSVISTVLFTGYYCFLRPPVRPVDTVVLVLQYIGTSWVAAAVLAMQFTQALKP